MANTEEEPEGYWMSTAISDDPFYSLYLFYETNFFYRFTLPVSNGDSFGSRPVIKISKSV